MIETERLWLRRFTLDDVDDSWEMNRQPEVRRYLPGEGGPSRQQVRRLIEENTLADYQKYGFGRLAIIHKADQRFIGFTGLKYLPDMDEVDVGYRLRREYWGRGLATEATRPAIAWGFQRLQLPRVIAMAMVGNKASIRVMQKLGMSYWKQIEEAGHAVVCYKLERQDFGERDA
jgi:RimJ/RimL family protein N-acetyltransferase